MYKYYPAVIDTETTPSRYGTPSPYETGSTVWYLGVKRQKNHADQYRPYVDDDRPALTLDVEGTPPKYLSPAPDPNNKRIFVGHNLGFDVAHLRFLNRLGRWNLDTTLIWDTQLAEYLLSGQTAIMPSLEEACARHGIEFKKDPDITEAFNRGVSVADLPREKVLEYLKEDVRATNLLAKAQWEQVVASKRETFFRVQMGALKACINMQMRGIHTVSREELEQITNSREKYVKDLSEVVAVRFTRYHGVAVTVEDLNSPSKLATLIFGGTWTYAEKVPSLKTPGRMVNGLGTKELAPYYTGTLRPKVTPKALRPSVDEETLEALAAAGFEDAVRLSEIRKTNKIIGTYLKPTAKHIEKSKTGKVHAQFNMTTTKTGRLSSSGPNLQNQPTDTSTVKATFVPAAGKAFLEFDYKQLEIVALAYLTQDPQLIEDITTGRDIHTEAFKKAFPGHTMTDKNRRATKTINFCLIYGGGAGAAASQAGVSEAVARDIRDAFFERYPKVKEWQENQATKIRNEGTRHSVPGKAGEPPDTWFYDRAPTGRTLCYKVYPGKKLGTKFTKPADVSYTEVRNFPVQSLATGDIVPMMMALLDNACVAGKVPGNPQLLIQVHDSLLVECDTNASVECARALKELLENAPQFCRTLLGLEDFTLPLKVDVKYSTLDWGHMDKIAL